MEPDPWHAAVEAAGGADDPAFAAHAEACRRRGGAHPQHLADLHLAWRAGQGDARAVRRLEEEHFARIDPAVAGVDPTPQFLEEVRQSLRVALLVDAGGGARIHGYLGRGPLLAWARVAAMRLALTLKRRARRALPIDELLSELVAPAAEPELRELARLYREDFGRAVTDALATLGERARVVLRLHFVERLALARIGALYDVHESTVSRWVTRAQQQILDETSRLLRERLGLSEASVASLTRALHSGLDLSIRRLLGEGGPP